MEKERETNTDVLEDVDWLPLAGPQPGSGLATQACALTVFEPATLRLAG